MSEVSQIRVKGTLYDIKDAVARLATGAPAVASTAAGMTDTSKIYVYTGTESGYTKGHWYYHDGTSWVSGGVYQSSGIETDSSLSVSGAAADAKVTGDAINNVVYVGTEATDSHTQVLVSPTNTELDIVTQADFDAEISDLRIAISSSQGMSAEFKVALENLVSHVAFIGDDPTGRAYIDALHTAMYPPANLTRISAVYTQSGTVYATDSIDSLKDDLTVTASYSNGTISTVAKTDYTLSGTLTEGTSTITVSYGGKTTSFNVTVSSVPEYGTFTPQNIVNGKYISDTGVISDSTYGSYSEDYLRVMSHVYFIKFDNLKGSNPNYRICEYDSTKNYLRQNHVSNTGANYGLTGSSNTFAFPDDTSYVRLSWYGEDQLRTPSVTINTVSYTDLPMEIGDIDSATGENKVESKRCRTQTFIPVTGSTITVSNCPFFANWHATAVSKEGTDGWGNGAGYFFRCYDSSHNIVGTLSYYNNNITDVALPSGTAYVRMIFQKNSNDFPTDFDKLVIQPIVINGVNYRIVKA